MKAVRNSVGATEIANFAKHEFTGKETRKFLDYILAIQKVIILELVKLVKIKLKIMPIENQSK